jgi:urease beta subunit
VGSHFCFFEVNRALRFDRAAAYGIDGALDDPQVREQALRRAHDRGFLGA